MGATFKKIMPGKVKRGAFRDAVLDALEIMGEDMVQDLQATTATWANEPDFDYEVSIRPKLMVFAGVEVSAGAVNADDPDEVWAMLNRGTVPHLIRPVRAKRLRFKADYVAKTVPGVLSSQAGGSSGHTIYSKGVHHPGTQARNWDKALKDKWEYPFRERMREAMKRGAQLSGHRM